MNADQWKRIEDLFNAAVEMPEPKRSQFLNRACNGDSSFRREVESLIARAHKDSEPLFSLVKDVVVQAVGCETLVGQPIGHYSITRLIGSGGMGEVYRAHDTKLKRDVAIKVLPHHLAHDAERVSRFKREAELLASLNHPAIAAIHGVEETGDTRCLILELVEGDTLQERLQRGPIPVEEALPIAHQIAEALEAAHQKGIVHRDLKPANIKLTPSGKVKLLDFGVAKIFEARTDEDVSDLPTEFSATKSGILIGTIAYMSPEQARGQKTDRASDIWAFGAVLYEMLTGKQAFAGDTRTDILGSIVKVDPDWNALPDNTPPAACILLRRCLDKNRDRRLHDIADVRIEIEDALTTPRSFTALPARRSAPRERLAWITAVALALPAIALAIPAYRYWLSKEVRVIRFEIALQPDAISEGLAGDPYPAISPDGRSLAFNAIPKGSSSHHLFVRALDSLAAEAIPGTEGIVGQPFWSPDSRVIGFIAGNKLKKVAISGGPSQVLCDAAGESGTWNKNDVIVFETRRALHKVSASGGVSTSVLSPSQREGFYRFPVFLPDGQHFVYSAQNKETGRPEVRMASLDGGESTPLVPLASRATYVPGYLLFARDGALMAQSFDAVNLKLRGEVFPLTGSVFETASGEAPFSASDDGTVMYRSTPSSSQLVWFDRAGKQLTAEPIEGVQIANTLSPDETKLAYGRWDSRGTSNIWIRDLKRGGDTPLTADSGDNKFPVWSPDGTEIAFSSIRSGKWELYKKSWNGTGAVEPLHVEASSPNQWTKAGILFTTNTIPFHISLLSSTDGKPHDLLTGNERHARFSPDGRFIVYANFEAGRGEVFVQPFPLTGRRWQVSVNGGFYPTWGPDGKEIFFMTNDNSIMAAGVKLGATFEAAVPQKLFQLPGYSQNRFPVTRDGRFLFALPKDENFRPTLTVVLNWTAGLKK